ncbi:carbohydrate binding family 9 domain-containing protein [candidate division WOR-3 bacterium]|nr:carbohydrate binding family 9 domain-containing protein [candidate division WOR-3 bacterium]
MSILGVVLLLISSSKVINVYPTDIAPQIDGMIEDLWLQADSAYDFIQYEPYENTDPQQPTAVYVLQDDDNLYIAFRCYADTHAPIACFTKDEDNVRVSIDPFGSKNTGYYFLVFASNLIWDGWVLDDGREWDDSWEGIWYRAIGVHDDLLEVEIKIPFKSIRYKKGLDEWGIQFMRYTAKTRETDYWTGVNHAEGELVSQWGTLKGINPKSTGHYFELYPEGYVRVDEHWYYDDTDSINIKPSASLNLKWDVTPQTTVNATAYPDFAQIESDPFTLNLSRYPTYLNERRPFFIEGTDIFHMSGFGGWGFFEDLELFYSRRIGRSLNGEAIPIIGGLKVTHNSQDWNLGLLGAYTGQHEEHDSVIEPDRGFGVFRLKRSIIQGSDIGLLFSGTMAEKDNYNYAIGIDGAMRKGANQLLVQGAMSDRNEMRDFAFTSGFHVLMNKWRVFGSAAAVGDSFDVNDVGFVPWAGAQQYMLFTGPVLSFPHGFLRQCSAHLGGHLTKEPGAVDYSYAGSVEIIPEYRNRWGNDISFNFGKAYEADTSYTSRSFNLSTWGNLFGQIINFGCWYGYTYNYARGYPAYQGSNWFTLSYSILPSWSTGVFINHWIEWDTTNTIISMMSRVRPNFFFRFTANMSLSLFSEFVTLTPESDFNETELYSIRPGLLYTWNFRPKSWIYIALNDYRAQDATGDLQHQYMIGAVKVKYLLYF